MDGAKLHQEQQGFGKSRLTLLEATNHGGECGMACKKTLAGQKKNKKFNTTWCNKLSSVKGEAIKQFDPKESVKASGDTETWFGKLDAPNTDCALRNVQQT